MKKEVPVIEDDPDIAELLRIHLEDLDCNVYSALTGTKGLELAENEKYDLIIGLETGADDYMTKPFNVRKFISRVKAIFHRVNMIQEQIN